jgi:hypothetical protein
MFPRSFAELFLDQENIGRVVFDDEKGCVSHFVVLPLNFSLQISFDTYMCLVSTDFPG